MMTIPLQPVSARPKGVVDPRLAEKKLRLGRYLPGDALAPFLDHYWVVEWDLRGQAPHIQRTLPYPCVNLVFDAGRTAIFGVVSGAFDYVLKDAGRVLGLRFQPGAFRALLGRPLSSITDTTISLSSVMACDDQSAEQTVLAAGSDVAMIAAAEALLLPRLPEPDPQVARIKNILQLAEQNPGLNRVQELADLAQIGMRSLQQLFNDYVGVSPKWVICRYRLQEAADCLASGEPVDLASLAQTLGYFDQAHFTADFQKLVGKPPAEYRKSAAAGLGAN